ncbi:MAG: glycyl-radical enzyme activating protein [Brevefilum sp.]
MPDTTTARILHLQRLSTEDGPGIRTTIFFKGCPLSCLWCHNPESIEPHPQVHWLETRCIGCALCLETCPNGALSSLATGEIVVDRYICQGCGLCAEVCPSTALEILGQDVQLDDLVSELLKDQAYFQASGGGVTASGGEPTLQAGFVSRLFARLQGEGVHTALDTCGACSPKALEAILPHTDLVLYDLKLMDSGEHRRVTGLRNQVILENLARVAEWARRDPTGIQLWIRTPLIPGVTASEDNLAAIGAYLADHLDGVVARWELCAFNNLCKDKYRRLGMPWHYEDTPLMSEAMLNRCEAVASGSAPDPIRVVVTGAASIA